MSVLAALARAYDRIPGVPVLGTSTEKIGFCIILRPDGSVASVDDLRDTDRKRQARSLQVPQARKRTSGIAPNFLWDKTSYVLGVGVDPPAPDAGATEDDKATHARKLEKDSLARAATFAAFRTLHAEALDGTDDEGLIALVRFLQSWSPDDFQPPLWPDEMRDQNVVFAMEDSYREGYLHDRPAAREAWARIGQSETTTGQACLVTGQIGAVARLHPVIKGVWNAQSSGASLVSFNIDAAESYGHTQGDNAPVSEDAAFRYGTVLNLFLQNGSRNRTQIGDMSTVFWADATGLAAELAENLFCTYVDAPGADERVEEAKIGAALERIRRGELLDEVIPELAQGVRFYILGLAPNAARLSVRFYLEDDFGQLTRNYQRHRRDMALEPPPRDGWPAMWAFLAELAVLKKRENIPPTLAGAWTRAMLTGAPYPMTLLSTVLMRIRADGDVNPLRVAMLRSVLVRNFRKEAPVALDPEFNASKGYLLGRLFAAYEEVQRGALGGSVNATIKDRFYGAACASPQKVFATLDMGAQNHFSKLRKASPGRAVNLEKLIMSIMDRMTPGDDPIPAFLSAPEQGLFGLGYYHQRSDFFRKRDTDSNGSETDA